MALTANAGNRRSSIEASASALNDFVVKFGDSLVNYGSTDDTTFGSILVGGTGTSSAAARTFTRGMFERCMIAMGQPLTCISNQGIVGQTTEQIYNRVENAYQVRYGHSLVTPGWWWVSGFSNDASQLVPVNVAVGFAIKICKAAWSQGINVVWQNPLPRSGMSALQLSLQNQMANTFADWARGQEKLIVLSPAASLCDNSSLANSYGAPNTSYFLSESGFIHPNSQGAGIVGEGDFVAQLKNTFKSPRPYGVFNSDGTGVNGDPSVYTPNPAGIQGSGGTNNTGSSGTLPQSWTGGRVSGSNIAGVNSLVSSATVLALAKQIAIPGQPLLFDDGDAGNCVKTSLTGTTDQDIFALTLNANTRINTGAVNGPFVIECDFLGTNVSSGTFGQICLDYQPGTTGFRVIANTEELVGDFLNKTSFLGRIRSNPFYLPAGSTGGQFFVRYKMTGATSAGDVYCRRPQLRALLG